MIDPVELAAELVRIESLSGHEGDLADFLVKTLRRFAAVERGPLGSVIAELRNGEGPTLVFEGHMDTVPPGDEAAWSVPPFAGEEKGGYIWGRGAVDMKGAIAAQIAAAAASRDAVRGTLYLVYVPHEETAEGAVLERVLDVIDVPDLVVLGEPSDLRLGIGHRGRAVIKLLARGKTAHASMPALGQNAITLMIKQLPKALSRELPGDPVLGKGTHAVTSIYTPTWGPIIPDRCIAEIDRRIVVGETRDSVLGTYRDLDLEAAIAREELRSYTGESFTVEHFYPAWYFDPAEGFVQWAWHALDHPPFRVWRFSTDGVVSAGTYELPTIGYGPGEESLAHQPDERVAVGDIARAAEGYRRLIKRMTDLERVLVKREPLGLLRRPERSAP
ncbi:MAG: M20/M25/M40 family metallo-hydrolase [Caldiserica bacterium]|nr:M20/M25/M40 family metallo-hydrolase [Caldisericota bacterium]